MGCLKLAYKRNDTTLKVAYSLYAKSQNNCTGAYRYGFNGKENDPETGTQDYGFRIYNPSLGKFLSVDPLTKEYPWNSTYAFAENDVIRCIDLEGAEKSQQTVVIDGNTGTAIQVSDITELPEQGPLGSGHETIIIKRYFYENGGGSWDDKDPANNQYMDEVVVTPPYDFLLDLKGILQDGDAWFTRNAKGSMDNYGELEGEDGRKKSSEIVHKINDVGESLNIPLVSQAFGLNDKLWTAMDIAAAAENGKYNTAVTTAIVEIAGDLIEKAVESALPERMQLKELKDLKNSKYYSDGWKEVGTRYGLNEVKDAAIKAAETKDNEK